MAADLAMRGSQGFAGANEPLAQRRPLAWVVVVACGGIVVDRCYPLPAPLWWTVAVVLLVACCAGQRWSMRVASFACLLMAVAAASAAWHHARWNLFPVDELGRYARLKPQPVSIEAVAFGSPRRMPALRGDPLSAIPNGDRSRVLLRALAIRDGATWRTVSGTVWLTIDGHLLGVHAGDRLRINAQLAQPSVSMNPGEFDFAQHRRGDRQLCRLWADGPAAVTVVERSASTSPWALLDKARQCGQRLLGEHLNAETAPMAAALLLGTREQLSSEESDAFFRTGMVHLLSISGLHVGLLALGLLSILRLGFMRRTRALAGVALLTLAYALVIQAEPPAVRATIAVLLVCGSMIAGLPTPGYNAVAAAALVVLAINPADLFRAGPQLSFLCALVLIWFAEHGPRPRLVTQTDDPGDTHWSTARRWSRNFMQGAATSLLLSLCIWLVSLPLIASQFHIVSPIAMVLTPLLAVPIAAALLSGFGVLVCGWLLPPVAAVLAVICEASLTLIVHAIEAAERLPGSHWWTAGPPRWWVAGFYASLLVAVWLSAERSRRLAAATILGAWCAIGCFAMGRTPTDHTLRATFLSVGHGLAVVLELPDGKTMVYDAGCLASPEHATQAVSCFLWSRRINRLDTVMISHADVDHYNGLTELLERFKIERICVSPAMLATERDEALTLLFDSLSSAGIPMVTIAGNMDLAERNNTSPPYSLRLLHPPLEGTGGSDNSNSLVLLVEFHGRRVLLTGDLESPGLERLLRQPPVDCDGLLAPHHGSARSDPPGLAAWSSPEFVVFSGGGSRDSRSAQRAYFDHGARTLHTAETGAVTVVMNDKGVAVTPFREVSDRDRIERATGE